ncbi:alanine--tRNA ligase [Mycoplasmopsis bovis]|uniref:alanine--tRNA ligase n=1 Tax=Mycoplasmopsis bovis TaxID=28903 RepID=UPI0027A899B8
MKNLTSTEIRQKWLDFFELKNHLVIESKSLIPVNDPSLLWINSGVATLKNYFSGKKVPPAFRLTNSQKAIRTNDIENVGVTSRHHTFFEMLGNFSIGNYFKKEAIAYAKEFLVNVLEMDFEKLYFTYYEEDLEAKNYWLENGVDESHLISGTRDTNFWDLGSGPCGPCTEIFYDRGEKYDSRGIDLLKNDIENDRYIEIWNIVFSQFNNDGEGNYTELKQKNIDTGAGLERLASIMQDVPTNYDSDLFINIIREIEKYSPYKYVIENYFVKDEHQSEINTNFKIIADHIRTVVNAIADGAKVSNVGRGYIIRRLLRRSYYKGMQLGIKDLFLHKLVKVVKDSLPYEYDEKDVIDAIKEEELLFSRTIEKGKILLESFLDNENKVFDGAVAFNLLETYGFPIELTAEILHQKGIRVDMEAFELAKEKHALASKGGKATGMDKVINSLALIDKKMDNFVGYSELSASSKVLKLFDEENEVESFETGGYVLLETTPFYATSGGQRHDKGFIIQGENKIIIIDVFKDKFGNHIHFVEGKMNNYEPVSSFVDPNIRIGLERNHSGTHLLFCALRNVLGSHIEQLGSDNNEERLTFDFPADEKPSDEQIKAIEDLVRSYITKSIDREYITTTVDKAREMGAIMTLEEGEYMDPRAVRVVRFGDITSDLCGGTHLSNTSKLESFKITNVEKKQAGVFRIRAISSIKLVNEYLSEVNKKLNEELATIIKKIKELKNDYVAPVINENEPDIETLNLSINKRIDELREIYKQLLKESSNLEFDYQTVKFDKINDYDVYINLDVDASSVKLIAASIRDKFQSGKTVAIIGSKNEKELLLAIATRAIDANKMFKKLSSELNGRGGGAPILAMGKMNYSENIESLIKDYLINA